jgi:hypothetical protein
VDCVVAPDKVAALFRGRGFDPATSGTTTIKLGAPTPGGFSTPSNFQQVVATVNP